MKVRQVFIIPIREYLDCETCNKPMAFDKKVQAGYGDPDYWYKCKQCRSGIVMPERYPRIVYCEVKDTEILSGICRDKVLDRS